jgi:hypothetical protein
MAIRSLVAVLLMAGVAASAGAADAPVGPYAGQENRPIKALSAAEVAALRNGEGMGMAKAAELNGYPGPAHALELAAQLGLDSGQVLRLTAIHDRMREAAKSLGLAVLDHEQRLDARFAAGDVTPEELSTETATIAELQGRLRAAHLAAHLATRDILTDEQTARYRGLRGYGEPAAPPHRH